MFGVRGGCWLAVQDRLLLHHAVIWGCCCGDIDVMNQFLDVPQYEVQDILSPCWFYYMFRNIFFRENSSDM